MKNLLKSKYDVGVLVGRFQVPKLHKIHKELIQTVIDSHKQVLVVVGISETLGSKTNPLPYVARKQMLEEEFPNITVTHIMDVNNDAVWSDSLDRIIRSIYPIGSVCLYGGRDSFINHYSGRYETFEFGFTDAKDGTSIRKETGNQIINSPDFRSGIIYCTQNQYPKVFPCADLAILKPHEEDPRFYRVLMGKRDKNSHWQFPGGFVDPNDKTYEETAIREAHEEVDVEFELDLKYVTSHRQEDWRYNTVDERLTTVLFMTEYTCGSGKSLDAKEFYETEWILVSPWSKPNVKESHKYLFSKLVEKLVNTDKLKKAIKTFEGEFDNEEEFIDSDGLV